MAKAKKAPAAREEKMTEEQLVSLVQTEFKNSQGAPGGDISNERAKALDYYLSKPFGDEEEGQSQVVTSDVADVVDGMIPSLLRIFTTADNLVDFDAVGSEDEPLAEQESDYVNHVFLKQQDSAFVILFTWFFDALVQKNGIVKAWWDESTQVTTESYQGLTDGELVQILSDIPDDELEITKWEEREAEIEIDGVVIPQAVVDITYRRTSKKGRVRVANVPPEEYRVSADANSVLPGSGRMRGHERMATRSELLDMGFDRDAVNALEAAGDKADSTEKQSRKPKQDDNDQGNTDKSQDKVLVQEGYIEVDYDGDGHSELRQVIVAGGKLLSQEETDRDPFHVITPQIMPHQHFGRPPAEKVMDTQRVSSELHRQVLNNLYRTNNPGHAVWEQGLGDTTLDDLLSRRIGSVTRFARPVSESYQPMTVPFTAAATFPFLEWLEKQKRDRTGVASDGDGLKPEDLKHIQQSVMRDATDMHTMKIEAVVRMFAETGLTSLFRHIHELLVKHQDKELVAKLRNKWVPVDPREWKTRENMTVRIGLGIGTRQQNLLHLNAIREVQNDMLAHGGMGKTITLKNLYNTASEIVKNANLKSPDMFFKDPGDAQPVPENGQAKLAEAQLELANKQLELQANEQQNDRERNLFQHKREIEKIKISQEKVNNDLLVAMEQIATKLTEIELKSGQNVPGAKV